MRWYHWNKVDGRDIKGCCTTQYNLNSFQSSNTIVNAEVSERRNWSEGDNKKNEKKILVTSKTEENLFNHNFFQITAVPMIIIILYIRILQTMFVTAILAKFCAISLRTYKPTVLSIFYINAQIRTCTYDAIHSHKHKHTRTQTQTHTNTHRIFNKRKKFRTFRTYQYKFADRNIFHIFLTILMKYR